MQLARCIREENPVQVGVPFDIEWLYQPVMKRKGKYSMRKISEGELLEGLLTPPPAHVALSWAILILQKTDN